VSTASGNVHRMIRVVSRFAFLCLALACGDSGDTTSNSGAGGTGAGAGGTGATGGGGSPGAAGAGGAAAPCELSGPGCEADEQCTVVDLELGTEGGLGCVRVGPQSSYSRCSAQVDCDVGLFCDRSTAVCKPLCDPAGPACESGGACVEAVSPTGDVVPGLHVCVADCSPAPALASPCGDGDETTCYYRDDLGMLDCAASAGGTWPEACQAHTDCAFSFACVGGTCIDTCFSEGVTCDNFTKSGPDFFCMNFAPCGTCESVPSVFGDAEVLVCVP
jgi:hypothetical protein